MKKHKLIRVTTVASSLKILLKGQHLFMSDYYEVIGVAAPGPELDDVVAGEGIQVVPIAMTRTISPFRDLRSVYSLYRLFQKEKPLIVHTHTPKAGIVGMLAAKMAGVPHRLHTVAGMPLMEVKGLKRGMLNTVEKLTYACATKVYPNSKGLYDFILKNKFAKAKKLQVIANGSSNGIDVKHFNPEQVSEENKKELRLSLRIEPEDFVFIFVGRLVGDKGLNELTCAFKALAKKNKQLKLLLVGGAEAALDPLKPETTAEIESNTQILSVGFQDDVRPYFAISNALVFPTYREGFPNVVMQAGAMGLPAIVTNINGCNEIIVEGENGTIIPTKHVEELQQAMKNFIENPKLNTSSARYRKLIVDRYQQQIVWDALLSEYQNLEKGVS